MTLSTEEARTFLRSLAPPTQGTECGSGTKLSKAMTPDDRWKAIGDSATASTSTLKEARAVLEGQAPEAFSAATYNKNVENFIGTVHVPVGLAGPCKVNGKIYYVPMATTEAALVASYSRGCATISESGGAEAMVVAEGVSRVPIFEFEDLASVRKFIEWITENEDKLRAVAQSTSSHSKLLALKFLQEGTRLHLKFDFSTGAASGQNMVTYGTHKALDFILAESPVKPTDANLDGGMSSDKKASYLSLQGVRGRKVVARAVLPASLCVDRLHATPKQIAHQRQRSMGTHALMGATGSTFHASNGLAALYIALGQDPACVSESHVGVCRFDILSNGDLAAQITLPNVMVGTVGGGINLPSATACLDILGLRGSGKERDLACVIATVVLGGELSICAALASNEFTKAHHDLSKTGTQASRSGGGGGGGGGAGPSGAVGELPRTHIQSRL